MSASSHIALQRVIVRMLYDGSFRSRVYDDASALDGLALDPRSRSWLTTPDPRSWRTDPHRRARSLTALLGEFPASAALAAAASGGAGSLDAFFSSRRFHDAVQNGASLAGAFGVWIHEATPTDDRVAALAALESAAARLARAPQATPLLAGGLAVLSSRYARLDVPIGTLGLFRMVIDALGPDPLASIAAGTALRGLPPLLAGVEHLLFFFGDSGTAVEAIPDVLGSLLDAASLPRPRADLEREAVRLGATPEEAHEILDDMIADGTLVAG